MLQFRETYLTTDPASPDGVILARSDPHRVMLRIEAGDVILFNPRITTRNEAVIDGGIPFDPRTTVVLLTAKDDGPMVTQEWRLNQAAAGTFTIFEVWDDEKTAFPVRVPTRRNTPESVPHVAPAVIRRQTGDLIKRLERITEEVIGKRVIDPRHPVKRTWQKPHLPGNG